MSEPKDPKEVVQVASQLSNKLKQRAANKLKVHLEAAKIAFRKVTATKYFTVLIDIDSKGTKQFDHDTLLTKYLDAAFKSQIVDWENTEIDNFIKQVESISGRVDELEDIVTNLNNQ